MRVYSFIRYLSAKKSVDDRALNNHVWQTFQRNLPAGTPEQPVRILEAGAGVGTMIERAFERGLLTYATYTALDVQPENISQAGTRLPEWAARLNINAEADATGGWRIKHPQGQAQVNFLEADVLKFAVSHQEQFDVLIAHAFLDLLDINTTLEALLCLLRPGGLFFFSLNFDGVTIFEPPIDNELDEMIETLYHRSMDERITEGRPSGDSRAGRRLFGQLKRIGARLLDIGASDWVVFPGTDGYPFDEAYFLYFILHFIENSLADNPNLNKEKFMLWLEKRRMQVEKRELMYLAHQLDFVGTRS